MTTKRICSALVLGALITTTVIALGPTSAGAAKAEPSISALGWWWEDAKKEERDVPNVGTITIETPNPFCPGAGGGTGSPKCSEGRLPIEVHNGDYENQNKISAVAFDMTLIPIGSKVNKFTVTFREAKEGCYERDQQEDNNPSDDVCEETNPINVGDHQLQACLVTSYFGDGEAREYKEAPKYTCTSADPKAKRKEVKSDKDGEGSNFYWTFDLTKYAQQWVSKFSSVTGIMLVGVPTGQRDNQDNDTWRVVLTGPKFENGVVTSMDYIPGEDPLAFPPSDPTDPSTTTTTTGTSDFGDTSTGTLDTGTDTGVPTDTGGNPTPAPTGSPVLAVEEPPPVEELPGYMWLALLAGLVGFSLVRSIVIEKTTGIRPDGVLATIHRLNAERGTTAAAAASGGTLSSFVKAIGPKLMFWKKG